MEFRIVVVVNTHLADHRNINYIFTTSLRRYYYCYELCRDLREKRNDILFSLLHFNEENITFDAFGL